GMGREPPRSPACRRRGRQEPPPAWRPRPPPTHVSFPSADRWRAPMAWPLCPHSHVIARRASTLAAILAVAAASLALADVAVGEGPGGPPSHPNKPVCPHGGPPTQARCHARVVTRDDGVTPLASTSPPSNGYRPADLQAAYNLPSSSAGGGITIAVIDAYDNPNIESDLAAYRTQWGLPSCTTGNGCFRKLNQSGGTGPYPSPNVGWGQEMAID